MLLLLELIDAGSRLLGRIPNLGFVLLLRKRRARAMAGLELRDLRPQPVGGLFRLVALLFRAAERFAAFLVELRNRLSMRLLEGRDLFFVLAPLNGESVGRFIAGSIGALEGVGFRRLDGFAERLLALSIALLESFHVGRAERRGLFFMLLTERGQLVGVSPERPFEALLNLGPRLLHLGRAGLVGIRIALAERRF